jgi:predicted acetyltransferase
MLPEARQVGLPYVEVVADLENVPSQRVILANGGTLIETFEMIAAYGNGKALRYPITL